MSILFPRTCLIFLLKKRMDAVLCPRESRVAEEISCSGQGSDARGEIVGENCPLFIDKRGEVVYNNRRKMPRCGAKFRITGERYVSRRKGQKRLHPLDPRFF